MERGDTTTGRERAKTVQKAATAMAGKPIGQAVFQLTDVLVRVRHLLAERRCDNGPAKPCKKLLILSVARTAN
jgi:hypothetical protein